MYPLAPTGTRLGSFYMLNVQHPGILPRYSTPVPNPSPSHSSSRSSFPSLPPCSSITSVSHTHRHISFGSTAGARDNLTDNVSPPGPIRPSSMRSPTRASSIVLNRINAVREPERFCPRNGGTIIHRMTSCQPEGGGKLEGGERDVQTVASATLGMSYTHRNSHCRPSNGGHPEMYTTRYAAPI